MTQNVKAAVFEQDGEYAAMVGMDTCHVPDGIHDFVTKRVNEYTGIVPVAIENGAEEESYEDMMCVDLGKYRKNRDIKNVAYPKDNKQHKNERSK